MALLGRNSKLYRNTATYESPTWAAIDLISDLSVNFDWSEAPASARESVIEQALKAMATLEVTFMLKAKPEDASYEALMNAALSFGTIDFLVLNASNITVGARGWRADMQVFSSSEDQGLQTAIYESMRLKPSIITHAVKAARVATGPVLTYSTPGEDGGTFA
jgi:hypothetical protein